MNIFPPRLLGHCIAICFLSLVLPSFSFAVLGGDRPLGDLEQEDSQMQHGAQNEVAAREDTDPDDGGSSTNSSDSMEREDSLLGLGLRDDTMRKKYLKREEFAALLAADQKNYSEQLQSFKSSDVEVTQGVGSEQVTPKKKKEKTEVTFSPEIKASDAAVKQEVEEEQERQLQKKVFLKQIVRVVSRLSAKYDSPAQKEEPSITIPDLVIAKARFLNREGDSPRLRKDDPWPTAEMTQLEADQEYYQAFKEQEEAALQFLDLNLQNEALYCHGIAIRLGFLFQYFNPDQVSESSGEIDDQSNKARHKPKFPRIHQQIIALSFLLKSPAEINKMNPEEKEEAFLSFQKVQEMQKKLEDNDSSTNNSTTEYKKIECKKADRSKDIFKTPAGFLEDQNGFTKRVMTILRQCDNDLEIVYLDIKRKLNLLVQKLKPLLPEEKKIGDEKDPLLTLLEKQAEKVSTAEAKENWSEIQKDLQSFEAIRPFAQEKINLLKHLIRNVSLSSEATRAVATAWQQMTPIWKELIEMLDQQAAAKVDSLQDFSVSAWTQVDQNNYISKKEQALAEQGALAAIENNMRESNADLHGTIGQLVGLGVGFSLVIFAIYEYYIHFVHAAHAHTAIA